MCIEQKSSLWPCFLWPLLRSTSEHTGNSGYSYAHNAYACIHAPTRYITLCCTTWTLGCIFYAIKDTGDINGRTLEIWNTVLDTDIFLKPKPQLPHPSSCGCLGSRCGGSTWCMTGNKECYGAACVVGGLSLCWVGEWEGTGRVDQEAWWGGGVGGLWGGGEVVIRW